MHTGTPTASEGSLPTGTRVVVIAARFNAHVVDVLLKGCVERLESLGVNDSCIEVHRVPGAFELPVAAKWFAETKRYRAIICLGCVIRGETAHFDYVAGEAARGIMQTGLETGVPTIFGVLTVENQAQADARSGGSHGHAGVSAAEAAAEMIRLGANVRK
jgi:6,7-dimethyl-8-ribityllumazine synthase